MEGVPMGPYVVLASILGLLAAVNGYVAVVGWSWQFAVIALLGLAAAVQVIRKGRKESSDAS